jgi:hypothetical protein
MSTPMLKVLVPPLFVEPRGARWAGNGAHRAGAAVRRGLQAIGQTRASGELLALARARAVIDPVLARQLRLAGEAAAVRALAHRRQKSDPRHAADLFAAADRHEQLAETPHGGA